MFVRHLMVTTVNGRPTRRTSLQGSGAHPGQHASHPARRHKAFMRQQPVIADAYGERCCEIEAQKQDQINWARPEPQSQETNSV